MQCAQHRMKQYANAHRSERSFDVGDMVYLHLRPYRQVSITLHRNQMLAPRFYGPFRVLEKIGPVAYRIELHLTSQIHPVFHVSFLKRKIGQHNTLIPHLLPVNNDGQVQFEPFKFWVVEWLKREIKLSLKFWRIGRIPFLKMRLGRSGNPCIRGSLLLHLEDKKGAERYIWRETEHQREGERERGRVNTLTSHNTQTHKTPAEAVLSARTQTFLSCRFFLFTFIVPDLRYLHGLRRMESSGTEKFPRVSEAEGSETIIEIKIKTLDSQTYTLKVDKQVPVPALKEQIASVTGVLSEQQRLICRGKVLKDDQLLSAYHVEDGHTLHMVVRQPIPPSADGSHNHPGTSHSHGASSVVIETFNVPDQGDGVPPEISQIVSAVLGSFGFSNIGNGGSGIDVRELASQRLERTSVASGTSDSTQQQAGTRVQLNRLQSAFGIPTAVSLGTLQPPVIPDSLTTLTQYLSHMRREFDGIGRGGGNNAQAAFMHRTEERDSSSQSGTVLEGLPTPASLAEVMRSTRQMLIEQVGESLLQLAGELDNQVNVNDPSLRMNTQSNAWRTGVILHNLGAFLLELGRTTMTLRLGQTPSEAVVNAGPAVFISPTGPNPLMVQPLPFQPGANFSAIPVGSVQPGSGLVNGRGAGFLPRRIDIQIRRGSSLSTANTNREERGNTERPSGQGNSPIGPASENLGNQSTSRNSEGSPFAGESGVRVVPIRTMMAAVPAPFGRLPSDSTGNSLGLYYPVLGRFQHVASGIVSGERGYQASAEHHSAGVQTDRPSVPDPAAPQHNTGDPARNGSLPNLHSRQEPASARSVNISILSASGTQNNQESEQQIPGSVLQLLRSLFPGGEIHVEDAGLQGMASGSVPEPSATPVQDRGGVSSGPSEAEASINEEGIFLSNLLHQIMPFISQLSSAQQNNTSSEQANTSDHRMAQDSSTHAESSNVETSRRHSDSDPKPPNSKRQKTE